MNIYLTRAALMVAIGMLLAAPSASGPQSNGQVNVVVGQTRTLLSDGRWVLLGGQGASGSSSASAAIWDAQTRTLTPLASGLHHPRAGHSATMLPDGTVLIVGGIGPGWDVVGKAERFDPSTGLFGLLSASPTPRAYHTATLLTDGRVLLVGGVTDDGSLHPSAELWDPRAGVSAPVATALTTNRLWHKATLLPDGSVRISGGTDLVGAAVTSDEVYEPGAQHFTVVSPLIPSPPASGLAPSVEAVLPGDGATDQPLSPVIGIRFSGSILVTTANSQTVTLNGPQGPETVVVTPAEGGMLVFVTPQAGLIPGATYSLTLNGLSDERGGLVPFTTTRFTTTRSPETGGMPAGSSEGNRSPGSAGERQNEDAGTSADEWEWKGERRDGRPYSQWQSLPPLEAPAGVTALAGQVLRLNGGPLADVTLRIERRSGAGAVETKTDDTGRFLLAGIEAGHTELLIDGRSASRPGRTYGVFEVGVKVTAGKTTPLGYTVWMPRIDTVHAVAIPTYTSSEVVIRTPRIPGLEVHIPAHAAIRDHEGRPATSISITPIPQDRPPFPLPRDVDTPAYFTIQPGAGYVYSREGKGVRLIYPNHSGTKQEVEGTRFHFWHYDPGEKGWHIYGMGTVTPNRQQVVPDPKVEVYEFTGAMAVPPPRVAPPSLAGFGAGLPPVQTSDGEPVLLASGFFLMRKTDLLVQDLIPIALTRTYLSGDSKQRAFGRGATHPYDIFLVGDVRPYTFIDLYLADGTWIHYRRISPGSDFTDAVYEHSAALPQHTATPTPFYGSKINWNPSRGGWDLQLKDGTVYEFPDGNSAVRSMQAALTGYRDRYGNALTLTRNSERDLTRITSPSGRWVQFTVDSTTHRISQAEDNIGRKVNYTYDPDGRLTTVRDPDGRETIYTYNANGWMETIRDRRGIVYLTNQYDGTGKVFRQVQPLGIEYLFHYELGNGGVVLWTEVTDSRATTRRVDFTLQGYPVSDTRGLNTPPDQQTTLYQWQPGTNWLTSMTDPLGRQTVYGYDTLGNLTSVTRLAGTATPVTTTLTYEPTFNQVESIHAPLSHTTTLSYDTAGNVRRISDPYGQETTITYTPAGQPDTITTSTGTTQLTYDTGDLVAVTDPLGTTTRFVDGAGRVVSVTDPRGNRTAYEWDPLNRLRKITAPLESETQFDYDENGNLRTVTDALNHVTTYTYDDMDRVRTRKDPDPLSPVETFDYDFNGNVTQVTDRRGKVTVFTYDSLNRRTGAKFGQTGPSVYESTIDYVYDKADRVRTVTDSLAGMLTLNYDDLDRLAQEISPEGTVGQTYDAANRRRLMTISGLADTTYDYDGQNRLKDITRGTAKVTFDYVGTRRSRLTLPNGVMVDYTWEGPQLKGLTYKKGTSTLGDLVYGYDSAGNRTRLGGAWARTGLPDAITGATYNEANQQQTLGSRTMGYDPAGNLKTLTEPTGTTNFTWDARGQLAGLTTPDTTVTFLYDGLGRRRAKIVNATRTDYLYDGLTPVRELQGTATANLLTGPGIDEYFTRTSASGTRTLLPDALGSIVALTDDAGAIQSEYTYEPFGLTTETGADGNPFQFTGRENDTTGLYYYRARYYHPTLQRFISEDPIEFDGGGTNLYAYVLNSPLNLRDPWGLWGVGAIASGSVEGGAVVVGGGATGSVGGGIFGGGPGGVNLGGFASLGAFFGGPGYGPSYPGGNRSNVVGGAFAGAGGGIFFSNAKCAAELRGPFDTYSFNIGVGPVKVSLQLGYSGGTWISSATYGPGIGVSGSGYPTNTWATGGRKDGKCG